MVPSTPDPTPAPASLLSSDTILNDPNVIAGRDAKTEIKQASDLTRDEKRAFCNPLPVLADRKFAETSITVGTLKEDAPITPRKRKLGDTVQTNQTRVQGAPVKLSMTREQAIENAILHWDANERRRVTTHNGHVIVALARARIVDFAEAGSARIPFIRQDLQINNRIVKLEPRPDGIAEYGACLVRIAEKCRTGGQLPNRL
ncbi:hypothetical protein FDECE_7143 [Fusarium decemcellulare]|nr:hypothetical protein FDECE_7143 [Fusarium decemcellulare]